MDGTTIAWSLGYGLAAGIGLMSIVTLLLLPASFMMNRFIYHTALMRLVIGCMAAVGSVFVLAAIVVQRIRGVWSQAHYFGLVPLLLSAPPADDDSGVLGLFGTLWAWLSHPLRMWFGPADALAYTTAVEQGLRLVQVPAQIETMPLANTHVPFVPGGVNTALFDAARHIATITKEEAWKTAIETPELTALAQRVYGSQ